MNTDSSTISTDATNTNGSANGSANGPKTQKLLIPAIPQHRTTYDQRDWLTDLLIARRNEFQDNVTLEALLKIINVEAWDAAPPYYNKETEKYEKCYFTLNNLENVCKSLKVQLRLKPNPRKIKKKYATSIKNRKQSRKWKGSLADALQQISTLKAEKKALEKRVRTLETENEVLAKQVGTLEHVLARLARTLYTH